MTLLSGLFRLHRAVDGAFGADTGEAGQNQHFNAIAEQTTCGEGGEARKRPFTMYF